MTAVTAVFALGPNKFTFFLFIGIKKGKFETHFRSWCRYCIVFALVLYVKMCVSMQSCPNKCHSSNSVVFMCEV